MQWSIIWLYWSVAGYHIELKLMDNVKLSSCVTCEMSKRMGEKKWIK